MIVALVILSFALLASCALSAVLLRGRYASAYRELEGRQVVAHLENRSLRGVLVKAYPEGYTLTHPEWLQAAQPANLGGSLFLPREKVTMLQVFEPSPEV